MKNKADHNRDKASIIINASNIRGGGALQVAVSAIHEMSQLDIVDKRISLIISNPVHDGLVAFECNLGAFETVEVFDSFGMRSLWSGLFGRLKNTDLVFTIFGPLYLLGLPARTVTGFAQPWIVRHLIVKSDDLKNISRFSDRLKYRLQAWWFARSDHLVVELPLIGKALDQMGLAGGSNIACVANAYADLYLQPQTWAAIADLKPSDKLTLGIVTRDYAHKNLEVLPRVKKCLLEHFNIDADIMVTLNEDEWNARDQEFTDALTNVGPLTALQCPTFYQHLDGVIFPSLLECFSVSILEAAMMETTLFASDRSFVRDVMGEHAVYVDPLDPMEIARSIACTFEESDLNRQRKLKAARDFVKSRYSAKKRAEDYLSLILKLARKGSEEH